MVFQSTVLEAWKPSNYDRFCYLSKINQTILDSTYNIKHLHNDVKVASIHSYFVSLWIILIDLISYTLNISNNLEENIICGNIKKHKELLSHVELSMKKEGDVLEKATSFPYLQA
jgi:hypothetical protein